MELFDVIKIRKSVRKYTDKVVEKEKLETILTAAQLAPSWRNGQCWKFIVVTDVETKKALIRCTSVFNQSWLGTEFAIIVAYGDPKHSGSRNDQPYYMVDVAIAMEHLVLAATDLGLGTCWVGGFDEAKVKELLHIPDNFRVVAMTPLGYPAESEGMISKITKSMVGSKNRKPLIEVYSMNQWE